MLRLLATASLAAALPSLPSIPDKTPRLPDPAAAEPPAPPADALFTVQNRCDMKAYLTYPKVRKETLLPTARAEVAAMGSTTLPCLDGRPLKVQFERHMADGTVCSATLV